MVVTDAQELYTMSVNSLWSNYMEATEAHLVLSSSPLPDQREEAKFYEAVARVSLTLYFEGVEIVLAELNRGREDLEQAP